MGNHKELMFFSRQILQDYLDGKLSEKETLEVQLYLADHIDDPLVQEFLNEQFDSDRTESEASAKRALSTVQRRLGIGGQHRPVLRFAFAAIAVLLAIPISLSISYKLHKEPSPVAWQEITVPISEIREVDLPDGTHLILNSDSRVTWPEEFRGDKREIFLDGEVMATVAKDPERPFIIHSGNVDVRVHGTTFDLKSYRNATMMELVLLEGSVSLAIPADSGQREVRLAPGDVAQIEHSTGSLSLCKVSPEGFKSFNDNRSFYFINIPLKDIASDLERSFGTTIVVADTQIASKRFLAFFTNGESLDEILNLLSLNGNLRVVRSDGNIYLYGKKS